ncbi:MAG: 6-bladed beta-propeller [Paludibacter sp.]|nr:6-bladed beta-propeller [Paludibacter sp.]
MKANLIYILIIASCISCSCSSRPSTERKGRNLIEIDPNKDDKVSVYDLFSRIEIIPLETKQNSLLTFLIGEPDRVIVHENNFYFLDDSQHLIIVFNSEGKFLKKISKKGNGPEEYISIDDFNINRFTGNLEVLSSVGRYINVYDLSENIFIERIKFPSDMPIVQNFHH